MVEVVDEFPVPSDALLRSVVNGSVHTSEAVDPAVCRSGEFDLGLDIVWCK